MTHDDEYFSYLKRRKRSGLWYRNFWLYPRICRHLNGTVLDVGCGIGDFVRHRAQTIGTDVNSKAVAYCLSQGLQVNVMQPDQLSFDDLTFDGAILDNVLEHLSRPEPLLTEIRRVLKVHGQFVVGVPGRRGFASDSDHKRHYPEGTLISTIRSAGFEFLRTFHQPFHSSLLDRHFRYYAIYGVFRRA